MTVMKMMTCVGCPPWTCWRTSCRLMMMMIIMKMMMMTQEIDILHKLSIPGHAGEPAVGWWRWCCFRRLATCVNCPSWTCRRTSWKCCQRRSAGWWGWRTCVSPRTGWSSSPTDWVSQRQGLLFSDSAKSGFLVFESLENVFFAIFKALIFVICLYSAKSGFQQSLKVWRMCVFFCHFWGLVKNEW